MDASTEPLIPDRFIIKESLKNIELYKNPRTCLSCFPLLTVLKAEERNEVFKILIKNDEFISILASIPEYSALFYFTLKNFSTEERLAQVYNSYTFHFLFEEMKAIEPYLITGLFTPKLREKFTSCICKLLICFYNSSHLMIRFQSFCQICYNVMKDKCHYDFIVQHMLKSELSEELVTSFLSYISPAHYAQRTA